MIFFWKSKSMVAANFETSSINQRRFVKYISRNLLVTSLFKFFYELPIYDHCLRSKTNDGSCQLHLYTSLILDVKVHHSVCYYCTFLSGYETHYIAFTSHKTQSHDLYAPIGCKEKQTSCNNYMYKISR